MYTLTQAREAIGNGAYFARGHAYVQDGRVDHLERTQKGGLMLYSASVRGHGRRYHVTLCYDPAAGKFTSCGCDCIFFAHTRFGCKHVAALMIAAHSGEESTPRPAQRSAYRAADEAQDLRAQRAQEQREAENAQRDRFVGRLLEGSRRQPALQEKVRLYPMLTFRDGGVVLEMRIGRSRPYVVRSLWEFASRVRSREKAVYGRELTFSHREDEVDERDRALFWHVASLAGYAQKSDGGQMMLRGAQLDQTMRLLVGRQVEVKDGQGHSALVPVETADTDMPVMNVSLERRGTRTYIRAEGGQVAAGLCGAYAYLAQEQRVVCLMGGAFDRLSALLEIRGQYPDGLPLEDGQLGAVCARLITPARPLLNVTQGQDILVRNTPMPVLPRFYVDARGADALVCRVLFDYSGTLLAPDEESGPVVRDSLAEEDALAAARTLFPVEEGAGRFIFEGSEEKRFELLSQKLEMLEAWGEVLVSEQLTRLNVQKRKAMQIGMSIQGDKLIVKGDLGGYTQDELRKALEAFREKRRYVRLDSGVFLSGEALEQAAQTAQVLEGADLTAEQVEAGTQTHVSRAMYMEEALKGREDIRLETSDAVNDFTDRLRRAQNTRAMQPAGLRCTLREYQLAGLSWLRALSGEGFGGILADDMGLGKTVQALAMLQLCREKGEPVRALVVCPASLQLNWLSEAQRFTPEMDACALLGAAQEREKEIAAGHELLITSYDQLRRDICAYEKAQFTHVLLDEAQNIKNASSLAAKAAKLLHAEHRFAMTGTPVENRLSELWSIFDFVMPGYLCSYKTFKERFEAPIVRDADEKARQNLRLMVAPFILRRMKKDVLGDLPEKVESVMASEMTEQQRSRYAAQAASLVAQADGGIADAQDRMRLLAGLTRLRQICCDPRLCLENYSGGSGKLAQCVELAVQSVEAGHRILLFSQFTSMLELLENELGAAGLSLMKLTGDTPKEERMRMMRAFNEGEGDVFLISLKAGGTGLNLTGADVVIHYDPWWNTSAQNQATDRAYRIGQTRGVQVVRLIAADSIEERIIRLQEAKMALADGVLEGEESLMNVDTELLKKLIRG